MYSYIYVRLTHNAKTQIMTVANAIAERQEKITSLKARIAYSNEAIESGTLEAWEVKEYQGCIEDNEKEIETLSNFIKLISA